MLVRQFLQPVYRLEPDMTGLLAAYCRVMSGSSPIDAMARVKAGRIVFFEEA